MVSREHPLVTGDLGGDPQLDLGVIGLDEQPTFWGSNVVFNFGKKLLESGFGAGHAPGLCTYLAPASVDPAVLPHGFEKLRAMVTQER